MRAWTGFLPKKTDSLSGRAIEASGDVDILLLIKQEPITWVQAGSEFISADGNPNRKLPMQHYLHPLTDEILKKKCYSPCKKEYRCG